MPPTVTWGAVTDAYGRLGEMWVFTVFPVMPG